MPPIRKTISYTLRTEVEEHEFLAASRAASADLATLEGFVERRLFRGDDGRWRDEVIWRDRASADASEAVITGMAGCASCISQMDHASFVFQHDDLVQDSVDDASS